MAADPSDLPIIVLTGWIHFRHDGFCGFLMCQFFMLEPAALFTCLTCPFKSINQSSLYLTSDWNAQAQLTIYIKHLTTIRLTQECWFTYVWDYITETEVQRPHCCKRALTDYGYNCSFIIIFIFKKHLFLNREDSCEKYIN